MVSSNINTKDNLWNNFADLSNRPKLQPVFIWAFWAAHMPAPAKQTLKWNIYLNTENVPFSPPPLHVRKTKKAEHLCALWVIENLIKYTGCSRASAKHLDRVCVLYLFAITLKSIIKYVDLFMLNGVCVWAGYNMQHEIMLISVWWVYASNIRARKSIPHLVYTKANNFKMFVVLTKFRRILFTIAITLIWIFFTDIFQNS